LHQLAEPNPNVLVVHTAGPNHISNFCGYTNNEIRETSGIMHCAEKDGVFKNIYAGVVYVNTMHNNLASSEVAGLDTPLNNAIVWLSSRMGTPLTTNALLLENTQSFEAEYQFFTNSNNAMQVITPSELKSWDNRPAIVRAAREAALTVAKEKVMITPTEALELDTLRQFRKASGSVMTDQATPQLKKEHIIKTMTDCLEKQDYVALLNQNTKNKNISNECVLDLSVNI
jgi:hypothetical protein